MTRSAGRLKARFDELAEEGRAGLVTFITAGDPNKKVSSALMEGLPDAGADIIELGMPFTDPMADGPAIQASSLRALKEGQDMSATLEMVRNFRAKDDQTPIILMGYFNPIYKYGVERFSEDSANAGIDGLIIVDIPPEEDTELRIPANKVGIDFIRLTTPTSDEKRLPALISGATGFIYYVSIAGITGTKTAKAVNISSAVTRIKKFTDLPIAIGFGIKTAEQAAEVARIADAAVVGSAIVEIIADNIENQRDLKEFPDLLNSVLTFVTELANGVRTARL
jgi:tryptophan synthase alpha chain